MQSEETLNPYYRSYEGADDEEYMIDFWKTTIDEFCMQIQGSFVVKPETLLRKFTLFGRVPCGLLQIMTELESRQQMVSKESILNGEFYGLDNKNN